MYGYILILVLEMKDSLQPLKYEQHVIEWRDSFSKFYFSSANVSSVCLNLQANVYTHGVLIPIIT